MKTYYYIYRPTGGTPSRKHETITDARIEAERLAEKHLGESFEILMCVGISQVNRSKTFWLDGIDPDSFA